jgi:hypothetical protein
LAAKISKIKALVFKAYVTMILHLFLSFSKIINDENLPIVAANTLFWSDAYVRLWSTKVPQTQPKVLFQTSGMD